MKIVKLNAHGQPVHELCHRSVLAEGLIVCQPNTTTKLAVRVQDEKLVRSQIFPAVGKNNVRISKKIVKALDQVTMSSMHRHCFLALG